MGQRQSKQGTVVIPGRMTVIRIGLAVLKRIPLPPIAVFSGSALASIACLGLLPVQSSADPSFQVPVGPRAIAMGGAFSSIANDASALFWNPAGLSFITYQEITATHANLFNTGIEDNYMAFALPLAPTHVVAADWYHSGFSDAELGFAENRFDLAYGFGIRSRVFLGLTAKYLRRSTDLDGATVREGGGYGADVGILARPWRELQVALVGQDLFDTEVEYSNGESAVLLPRNVRFGASYTHAERYTIAMDVDDRFHLGTEIVVLDPLVVRGGLQDDRRGNEDATYAFGIGFKLGFLRFDYAYENHPTLNSTNHFGVSFAFNFNPSQVRIEKVDVRSLYSSLYKTYSKEAIGSVRIQNLKQEPLPVTLSVFVPGFMQAATQKEVLLRPRTTQEVPFTAVLSEEIMQLRDDRPIQVQVSTTYTSARLPRTDRGVGKTTLYAPGAIDWGEGVAQAAAFVTAQDPGVSALAREVSRLVARTELETLGNKNLALAAGMFAALRQLGVTYVSDPNTPYADASETEHAVDTIHYPRETLRKRTGDCDDTSVLMASLLENVGVPTKLVDAPGHIMILFGLGIHERNRIGLLQEEELYVVQGDEIWIPLETTALSESFPAAWRRGAEEYHTWASRGQIQTVDVMESQSRYAPALPAESVESPSLDEALLMLQVRQDANVIAGWRREYLASRYGEKSRETSVSESALNEIAHVYLGPRQLEKARNKLQEILLRNTTSARAHNNLGVVEMVSGGFTQALDHFETALRYDPSDAGIWLNVGVARCATGDPRGATDPFNEGLQRAGGVEQAAHLLGLLADEAPGVGEAPVQGDEAERIKNQVLKLLGRSGAGAARPTTPGARVQEETKRAGTHEGEVRLEEHLYWKD